MCAHHSKIPSFYDNLSQPQHFFLSFSQKSKNRFSLRRRSCSNEISIVGINPPSVHRRGPTSFSKSFPCISNQEQDKLNPFNGILCCLEFMSNFPNILIGFQEVKRLILSRIQILFSFYREYHYLVLQQNFLDVNPPCLNLCRFLLIRNQTVFKYQSISKTNQKQNHIKMKYNDKPTVSSIIVAGRRRLMYAYEDGKEMVQEYDMKTHQILSRKIKKPTTFKQTKWDIQIGEVQSGKISSEILSKSNSTPIFIRKDTLECFQWRIRNLSYPAATYLLDIDPEKQEVVIKTTIKKYYKRFDIPDMKRMNIKIDKEPLSFTHQNNTLVVSYKKPQVILQKELILRKEFEKMNLKKPKQGDIECTTQ